MIDEFKRELELIKEQCQNDPGSRANWTGILILLGFAVLIGVFLLAAMF